MRISAGDDHEIALYEEHVNTGLSFTNVTSVYE